MEVVEAIGDVGQLVAGLARINATREDTYKPKSVEHGVLLDVFGSSPPDIQSEMSWGWGEIVTPRRGTMFGWFKLFHITASWQKACDIHEMTEGKRRHR
jgi:hypothetical protein